MPAFITFGRILFIVIFIFSGASKFMDLPGTTAKIEAKVAIPAAAAPYAAQVQDLTGMTTPQLLAIVAAATELVCGILIALNFGSRFFALVLVLFVLVTTFYFHDFWNMADPAQREGNMIQAQKNLSLIGGLFLIAGIGGRRRGMSAGYNDV